MLAGIVMTEVHAWNTQLAGKLPQAARGDSAVVLWQEYTTWFYISCLVKQSTKQKARKLGGLSRRWQPHLDVFHRVQPFFLFFLFCRADVNTGAQVWVIVQNIFQIVSLSIFTGQIREYTSTLFPESWFSSYRCRLDLFKTANVRVMWMVKSWLFFIYLICWFVGTSSDSLNHCNAKPHVK